MKSFPVTVLIALAFVTAVPSSGQSRIATSEYRTACDSIRARLKRRTTVDTPLKLEKIIRTSQAVDLYFNRNLADFPWRSEDVTWLRKQLSSLTPAAYKELTIRDIYTNGQTVEDLVVPSPGNGGSPRKNVYRVSDPRSRTVPLVSPMDRGPFNKGLSGRHIALWQSHGRYYEVKTLRWEWQRAPLQRTVEDMYTQSYVLPFLIPMLENAGACVVTPRERDVQPFEVVCDNDPAYTAIRRPKERKQGRYSEKGSWKDAGEGFADYKAVYTGYDNPFKAGKARQTEVNHKKASAEAIWTPDIPERGFYSVYVSYKTFPKSTDAACYTVFHMGGESRFKVNQKMGGGTWVYLGTFEFDKGENGRVVLDNSVPEGSKAAQGSIVSADAVRFGGGMSKVARGADEKEMSDYTLSGMPCYAEGALYALQWAGIDLHLFDEWDNDYTKDYACRGAWVSHLAGGSRANPTSPGKKIPFDVSLAFHSDAGVTPNDSTVGTLAIYTLDCDGKDVLPNGESRMTSRMLTDMVQTQVVEDIRREFDPKWSRRQTWDRSYSESRTTSVPGMLLELLSHQNFGDMKYGLDPTFRFTASRAVYKGILKYLSSRYGCQYVVQPLPVSNFYATLEGQHVRLGWTPTEDPAEKTAAPSGYILYTRIDDGAFDNGRVIEASSLADGNLTFTADISSGHVYSYRIAAFNEGGISFPSETMSVGVPSSSKGTVLIVNNFDRVCAPAWFDTEEYAGFDGDLDGGVPYIREINYIGEQYEFRREIPWMDDDNPGFGASYRDRECTIVAGNTFDYPSIHGKSLLASGYAFVSASKGAFCSDVNLGGRFFALDLICGKQVTTKIGAGAVGPKYEVFPKKLRSQIAALAANGVNILVSGSNVGTDLWDTVYEITPDSTARKEAQEFVMQTLGYKWLTNYATRSATVVPMGTEGGPVVSEVSYRREPNPVMYAVETADGLMPASDKAQVFMRYADTAISAAVCYSAPTHKAVTIGIPVEVIKDDLHRDTFIKGVMDYFAGTPYLD